MNPLNLGRAESIQKWMLTLAVVGVTWLTLADVRRQSFLQQKVYWGGGSRYVEIARQGDRWCYQGWSPNGRMVASIHPQGEDHYQIYGFPVPLKPIDRDTIELGDSIYQSLPHMAVEGTPELERCLSSSGAYRHQIAPERASNLNEPRNGMNGLNKVIVE